MKLNSQLDKMIRMIKIWLKKNGLDTDTAFYTIEEWRERKEDYHNDAEFVIVTEGGLHFLLNYGDSDEFWDLVNSFGYYYELGHTWNLGFYKDEPDEIELNESLSYSQKLKDKRWVEKRDFVRERAEFKCEDCGSNENIQVHHCYYLYNFEPWEYPFDALRCLCNNCHENRGSTEMILRGHLASLKTPELNAIISLIDNGLYWYPREKIFALLQSFKYDQKEMSAIFDDILKNRLKQD